MVSGLEGARQLAEEEEAAVRADDRCAVRWSRCVGSRKKVRPIPFRRLGG